MSESSPIYKTRFYSDCIGVFQGGGCRAAAFGGAYDAAFKLGVRFSEVAGTSAGAIVASLLAAGASPSYLLEKLNTLNFSGLVLNPTRSTFSAESKVFSLIDQIPLKGDVLASIFKAARFGGLHSSEGIESWVESCLKELTGRNNGPVCFSDLSMPLHVVASDLSTMKPRIWSNRTTPSDSVAHAVRASCSIPLFFQPVEEGSTLLVDGGIVSNLPHFLFAGDTPQNLKRNRRILLFMLEATEERKRAENAKELILQLVSLAIDGGTAVQLAFTPDIARLAIPTGSIRATDFDQMDAAKISCLVSDGQKAATDFIFSELLTTQGSATESAVISDEHEAFLVVCERLYQTRSIVRFSMPDTKWFWEIFPTVYFWRRNGIRIVIFLPPLSACPADEPKEKQRRGYLKGLGVELVEMPSLPFHGILFDTPADTSAAALVFLRERSDYEPFARFYSTRLDQAAVTALHSRLVQPAPGNSIVSFNPLFRRVSDAVLLKRLREGVQFYRAPGVRLTIEDIEVSKVQLISRYVRAFRYKQIGSLVDIYAAENMELFAPAQILLNNGESSLVTPPVVEETNSLFVALEGNTRFLYCLNNSIEKVKAVVVRGVCSELPGKPVPLKNVRITTIKHPPEERMTGFNRGLFRDIERAVRPIPQ